VAAASLPGRAEIPITNPAQIGKSNIVRAGLHSGERPLKFALHNDTNIDTIVKSFLVSRKRRSRQSFSLSKVVDDTTDHREVAAEGKSILARGITSRWWESFSSGEEIQRQERKFAALRKN
jgi:hypothetical protein